MKILFAADGSKYTKKAAGFLMTHEALANGDAEVVVLNVQPAMPPRVKSMVGAQAVRDYQTDEAGKVLQPIDRFLARHGVKYRTAWTVGVPGDEIVKAAQREGAHMVVMGTHGHGILGRALLGSVAQHVVTDAQVPVLLVK
jgi:nucleotide-binding universal stress UspA family protein